LFDEGRPVCDGVSGRLRWELRATWLGGTRVLDKLDAADYDVFHSRPVLTASDGPPILWNMIRWRRGRRSAVASDSAHATRRAPRK
jgi:hypothetical protein